ncbi:MarR family winged helix-turn-helix transcriptional regulator [Gryllotalpicola ginsengisoli]|uniref:MarR family winged helix-turn-helix transcriptional regulator n=1 Tax=Gryllotalpicola ginsengisoli TaxID=444608 RepID=UPI0003B68B34|nr:MarR family transcriptional regulator [Gryllotalpicola ginsengisoli]
MADSAQDNGDGSLVDALARTSYAVMAVLSRVAAEHDLSLTQLRVFGILRDRRVTMSRLAEYLGLEKSTLTGLMARAEKRGLVERAANPDDRRAVDVYLSAAGLELAETVSGAVARELAALTAALSAGEQGRLRALLERMLEP